MQQLDMRSQNRLYAPEFSNSAAFAPAREAAGRQRACRPRVPVANAGGEEFEETQRGATPAQAISAGRTGPELRLMTSPVMGVFSGASGASS